jgi:hypothetical protein
MNLLPNASYYAAGGGGYDINYMLSIKVTNVGGVGVLVYLDEGPTRYTQALCEMP